MSVERLFDVLLQVPMVIGLAFGALLLCLGLALLLGGGLHRHAALTLSDRDSAVSPWISIHVQTWRRWAAYHGDPSLQQGPSGMCQQRRREIGPAAD